MIHAAFNQAHLQFSAQWLYDSKQGLCLILCAGLSASVHVYSILTSTVVSLRQDQLLSMTALCCSRWRRVRKCLCSCFFSLFVQQRTKKKSAALFLCLCVTVCVGAYVWLCQWVQWSVSGAAACVFTLSALIEGAGSSVQYLVVMCRREMPYHLPACSNFHHPNITRDV